MMNTLTQTEKLKAKFMGKVSIECETKIQEGDSDLYKKKKEAEASLYEKEKEAEAQKATAEATLYSRKTVADAELYAKQKEAEGLVALAQAQGSHISILMDAFGGNYAAFRDYHKTGASGGGEGVDCRATQEVPPALDGGN
ncbi:hypothetical protein L2E82_06008 [Cichorium intybus]|uniref:Uncharacterized protein n=1 Tax=Cichorium intybus TaxID=13427 RepID=A0ACB9H9Y9_CICIN|nr:hypothetical protein L2E82_06008 [Cichorium intybus]